MLLRALERRLKTTVPEDLVAAQVRSTTDLVVLERWFDWAGEVSSLEEFRQRVQS